MAQKNKHDSRSDDITTTIKLRASTLARLHKIKAAIVLHGWNRTVGKARSDKPTHENLILLACDLIDEKIHYNLVEKQTTNQ